MPSGTIFCPSVSVSRKWSTISYLCASLTLAMILLHLFSVNGHKTELEGYQKWLPLPVVFLELREYGVRPEEQEDDCADIYRLCCLWTQWEAFPVCCHTNEFAGKDSDSSDGSPATDFSNCLQTHLYLANTRAEVFRPAPETLCPAEFISNLFQCFQAILLQACLIRAGDELCRIRVEEADDVTNHLSVHTEGEDAVTQSQPIRRPCGAGQSDFSWAGLSSMKLQK